ncbi:MAG: endo-1,4-beta-xylanase [Melioribacter sp.]|nr:endo-1,4-beta-xylanase [Melioribacter sp.]
MYKKILISMVFLFVFATIKLLAQTNPKSNLIHSWTFDNGTAVDNVAGIAGVLKGEAKILNGALNTTASNSWLELPANLIAINKYQALTFEIWFRSVRNGNTGFHMIAAFGNTKNSLGVNYFFITPARADNKTRAAISCLDESTPWASESGVDGPELDDGKTHQIISTINSESIKLYIDGMLIASSPLSSNNKISNISTNFAYLAKSVYSADPTWRGEIYEFNIYNKALSDKEILDLYNSKPNLREGNKPIIVEAESGKLGNHFVIKREGNISYITTTVNYIGQTAPGDTNRIATYRVTFPDSGRYNLFLRVRVGSGGYNDDSFFYARGFGIKRDTARADWVFVNGLGGAGFSNPSDVVNDVGTVGSNVWKWVNVSKNTYSGALGHVFYVSLDSLTKVFQIASREDGLDIDKIAFGKANLLFTVANLDSVQEGSSTPIKVTYPWNGPPLAHKQPKFVGNIYSPSQRENFESYWNQVIPENAGKWGSVEATRNVMNWSELDAAYKLAKDNGFPFNFHVLIWGAQQPSWINNLQPQEQLAEIREWFQAVANRYPDIDILQVVNEPLPDHNPPDGTSGRANYKSALGGNGVTGWDWVINAFKLAREIFPKKTKLMINDFNIVNSTSNTSQYLKIIRLLQKENLIDAIGVQGHAFSTATATVNIMRRNLDSLASTGLPIYVTEMDIDGPTDDVQLNEYKRVFPTLYEHPGVKGITLWGWRPGLWRNEQRAYLINPDGSERPALVWLRNYLDTVKITVDVKEISQLPKEFKLYNNYPNPFNPITTISYDIPVTSKVSLKIYNLLGEEISTLFEGIRQPGHYQEIFDGSNLNSGVYFYRLVTENFIETKKFILLK